MPLNCCFDPAQFQAMLDAPAQRAAFSTAFPHARSLFEEYLEATAPALSDFPADGVTALQFTLFDNKVEPQGSTRRMLTMKSRFALNVKAWDRLNIDWRKSHQTAWEASACLKSGAETEKRAGALVKRELIPPHVGRALAELHEVGGPYGLYGLCHQRKPGMGSRWTDVLVYLRWNGIGLPTGAFILRPDLTGFEVKVFEKLTATGAPLGGNAVAQARVAYHERFAGWATETLC